MLQNTATKGGGTSRVSHTMLEKEIEGKSIKGK